MNCQAKSNGKTREISALVAVFGEHMLLSLVCLTPPETAGPRSRLRHPPVHLLGSLSPAPPAALRQHPGTFFTRWKHLPELFSKWGPKVWSRAAVLGGKQSAMLKMNKTKAIWSLLGEETQVERNANLTPKCTGSPVRGYAAGREELGLRQWRHLWSGTMEEFHL